MPTPVRADDTDYLMSRMQDSLLTTSTGYRNRAIFMCGLFLVFTAVALSEGAWFAAAFLFAIFGFIFFVSYKFLKKNSPERMKPVMEAVRDAPETIKVLRHYQTSDTRQVFVTDWIAVATEQAQFLMRANKDWERLMAILKARCPNAKVLEK